MAKIHEEVVIIKLSRLVKNDDKENTILTEKMNSEIEQVVQELVGDNVIVELEIA